MSEDQAEYLTEALGMLGKGYGEPIPPTLFNSTLSGFTPAPDILIKEYGYVTALVWGRTWRYCQMDDGVCRAKLEKIGESLGMSERTIIRHLDELCKGGYLYDTTPNLKNRPHIYADTGKIKIRFSVEAGVTESQRAMTESQGRVTESQRQGDRESVEESIKKQVKKPKKNKEGVPPQPKATEIPELVLFRDVVRHWPRESQRDSVVEAIQQIGARLGRPAVAEDLLPWWKEWGTVSGNEWSLVWLVDWAVNGKRNSRNGHAKQPLQDLREPKELEGEALERALQQANSLMEEK